MCLIKYTLDHIIFVNYVSPKGINSVWTGIIPWTKFVPSPAPDQETPVDIGTHLAIKPSPPGHLGTKKITIPLKTHSTIFNCEHTSPALLCHFFLKIRGIIKPARFLCYFITPGPQHSFLGCPESLPCGLGWFLHVPSWHWDGLAVKGATQSSPPEDAKCTFLLQNTPSDVGGCFPSTSEAPRVLLCLWFHILTHTLVPNQLGDPTKMQMRQRAPANNQLWVPVNFRSPWTLSEEPFSSLISPGAFPSHILHIPKPCLLLYTSTHHMMPCKTHRVLKKHPKMSVTDFWQTKPCISKGPLAAEFIQPPNKFCPRWCPWLKPELGVPTPTHTGVPPLKIAIAVVFQTITFIWNTILNNNIILYITIWTFLLDQKLK